jgi:hypothetical protein
MRKILCGKGKRFFLTSQSVSLDRFRLQDTGLRARQFNLQPGRKKKTRSQIRWHGKVEKVSVGRKTFNEIKNAVKLEHTHRTAS